MTLKPFSESIVDKVCELYKNGSAKVNSNDLKNFPFYQFLVEKGYAEYNMEKDSVKLTGTGNDLYKAMADTIKQQTNI